MSENLVKRPLTEAEAVEGITWATNEIVSLRAKIERLTRLYDEVERLRAVVRSFMRAAIPVAPELYPRGFNWCEAYLDEARAEALKLGSLDKGQ